MSKKKMSKKTTARPVEPFIEPCASLPVVELSILFRQGAASDPKGMEGLTRLVARSIRAGTERYSRTKLDEVLSLLGARVSVDLSFSYIRVHGTVLRRNLERFVAILSDMVFRPSVRPKELTRLKRETLAALEERHDDDGALAARVFRAQLFRDHVYGQSLMGSASTLAKLGAEEVRAHHKQLCSPQNLIVGASGDIDAHTFATLRDRYFPGLSQGASRTAGMRATVANPRVRRGRHLVIVDKPDRNQVQMIIGALGTKIGAPDAEALTVGNCVFGGTFSSTLTQEVRAKRGWSYGASSRLSLDRARDSWSMYTFPGADYAAKCAALQLRLFERWVDKGSKAKDIAFAQGHLLGSHCFEVDTAAKRLEDRMDLELFGLPKNYPQKHLARVRQCTADSVRDAVQKRLSPANMVIVAVATADKTRRAFERIPGLASVEVVPANSVID